MKKVLLLCICTTIAFALPSCKEDAGDSHTNNTSKKLPALKFLAAVGARSTLTGSDLANVWITNSENIDAKIPSVFSVYSASFQPDASSISQNVGTVYVGGTAVPNFSSDHNYLLDNGQASPSLLGTTVSVALSSTSPDFQNFNQSLYVSKRINATTNLGITDYFRKNGDLTLNWDRDANNTQDKVYIAVCAQGVPAIVKEVDDTGSYTIDHSEFSNFQAGSGVFLAIGRGNQYCFDQPNGITVCLNSVSYARSIMYTVL